MRGGLHRRGFLQALAVSLAACVRPRRADVATAVRAPKQFAFHDAMPAFFSFWARAAGNAVAEQKQLFREIVIGGVPELYTPGVLGLPDAGADAELDRRLDAWLPTLAALVPRMRLVASTFGADVREGAETFRRTFTDFGWAGDCYAFASVDAMNGGTRDVHGRPALLFGLDVVAQPTAAMPARVLFAHELFHVHQIAVLPPHAGTGLLYDALWSEGLATYASTVVVPGTSDREALPVSHLHDPAHAARDIPARRVALDEVMPPLARELGGRLAAALDSADPADYATFFLGRASASLGERPVRSGYWFGLQIARALARGRDIAVLAHTPPSSLRLDIAAALAAITAGSST